MKNAKKALILVLCAALLVGASVMGTLAFLQDETGPVTNTFTVGNVTITMDEAKVTEYGVVDGTDRVTTNTYKLIPGHTYTKDPTMTVKANSEESYVRMLLTIKDAGDLDAVLGTANKMGIFKGFDDKIWDYSGKTVLIVYGE